MEILFPGGVTGAMTSLSALSLLVFSLLYTPCVASISSIRREMGRKWAIGVVLWQCAIAWAASFLVYAIASLL